MTVSEGTVALDWGLVGIVLIQKHFDMICSIFRGGFFYTKGSVKVNKFLIYIKL